MGRWAMGIAASDEYQEVKDEFFLQFYYTEKPVAEIERSILDYYHEEYASFDEKDGVWHDIYFSLANSEWECGVISENIYLKVKEIIKNKLDLLYLESLLASPRDLIKREKALNNFLVKLSIPKEKPIRRRLKKPFLNPFSSGDVFQYRHKGNFYGGIILQVWDSNEECNIIYKEETLHYCIAVSEIKSVSPLTVEQIENSIIRCVEWIMMFNLPKRGNFEILDNIYDRLSKDYRNYFGAHMTRYGMSLSGCFDENFLDIISGIDMFGGDYTNHLRKNGVINKPINYLFDTNNLIRTKC